MAAGFPQKFFLPRFGQGIFVSVSIYLLVKFVRKKLDEARDRRFQREHQVNPMAEAAKEKPDEK